MTEPKTEVIMAVERREINHTIIPEMNRQGQEEEKEEKGSVNSMLEWINVGNVGELTRIVGGPMFLLCCQALSGAVA